MTTYIERRIIESLYGRSRADMEAVLGIAELRAELQRLPPKDQVLKVDLSGRNPEDGMTCVPYEKGALLLRTIEQAFGRERFDAFLRDYFDSHRFQGITTHDFEVFLRDRLLGNDPDSSNTIDLGIWLEQPGIPTAQRRAPVEPARSGRSRPDRLAERLDSLRQAGGGRMVDAGMAPVSGSTAAQAFARAHDRARPSLPPDRAGKRRDRAPLALAGHSQPLCARRQPARVLPDLDRPPQARRAALSRPGGNSRGAAPCRAIHAKARIFYHPITNESVAEVLSGASGRTGQP